MKQARSLSGIVIGGAAALLTAQPSWAAATQVTAVRLNKSESELKLILETKAGEARPQVITGSRGNDLVTDIVNTELHLSEGNSFRQENPMPGITSLVVSQLDANRVRVTVSGTQSPPKGQILQSEPQGITLSLSTASKNQAAVPSSDSPSPTTPATAATVKLPAQEASTQPTPTPNPPTTLAQTPTPQPVTPVQLQPSLAPTVPTLTQSSPRAVTQTAPQPNAQAQVQPQPSPTPTVPTVVPPPAVPTPSPDVLVPNPTIRIEGNPAPATGAAQPVAPAPPFLPRAIAPPVGDIAISNINASAGFIDLGTAVRVPRLVLREAPVREVLALLARSAGLNVAFTGGGAAAQPGAPPGIPGATQQTISLDLENESVQDVFNYVLQISGLQANRVGRTILVGSQLPDVARNIISRTLRLNQASVGQAVGFLISQGAEQQQITTQTTLTVVGEGAAAQRIQNTTTQVQKIAPQDTQQAQPGGANPPLTGPLVLRGLAVSPDERLNSITLIGEPRKVEIASALLTQLDLRRRQVAVNVKVVDVNLAGTDAFNASFSFGIGNTFFSIDGGINTLYGRVRPPDFSTVGNNTFGPPVTGLPIPAGATQGVFFDPQNDPPLNRVSPAAGFPYARPNFGTSDNPFQPGVTSITPATATTPAQYTFSQPGLFQYPKRLLAALQAQVTSNNAKILTDPTLIVQEGQTATVLLTSEVFGGFRQATQTDPTTNLTSSVVEPIIKNAGLTLQINVLRIDDNGFITMTVNPIVSAPSNTIDTGTGATAQRITLISERRLESGQIRLRDAQTLILTGIIQETDQTSVSKVPILGDIPILGALFRRTNRTNGRNEVVVLVTPQIIQDTAGSSFGYNYAPGQATRDVLQRQGVSP